MSIAKTVEQYIGSHPGVRTCLLRGLVNYSKLARRILAEEGLGKKHFDAVLVACQRYRRKTGAQQAQDEKIRAILEKSRVDIKTRIAVVVVDKPAYFDDISRMEKKARRAGEVFYAIEGARTITLVSAAAFLSELRRTFRGSVMHVHEKLVLVSLDSPRAIEETPGTLAYLLALLSAQDINVVETMSCWSETLFVVGEKDLQKTVSALSF